MAKKTPARKPRNYAANDATLINIRSLKNYVEDLQLRVAALEAMVKRLDETRIPVVHADTPASPSDAPDDPKLPMEPSDVD